MLNRKTKYLLGQTVFHIIVILLGFLMLYPILWMISNSFKTNAEIFGSSSLMPESLSLEHYIRGWRFNNTITFTTFFKNSFYYTILSTFGAVIASSLVAYGFARVPFRGRSFWYACMFLTMMIPYQVVMVPQFIIFHKIGWINSFKPLIIPQFAGLPFFIFLMVQFIRQIPYELDDSAKIDGCNRFMIYSRILFPLIKPAVITSTIFSFYWRWDDFLGPLLFLNKPRLFTVSLALRMFSDPQTSTDWSAIFAMGTLSLLPVLIIFLVFQKYIVQGLATTGLKG
ncbi:carbohydrate ABC transporter permease [uncultured Sphaerochaeta sp.]|uniref:carbohydrate ABC transporter permease n=1 Tax=uncultured Sphaerochaeta sp. TaxID=886478 RepID=UPI0029C9E433|nr:carbohydrate ABC transporter permease [uncultured Sphaerochaeta sp.]MDC7229512.1 carbohydrate ABC transporter permease [Sphaerochaetaceae bacterium]